MGRGLPSERKRKKFRFTTTFGEMSFTRTFENLDLTAVTKRLILYSAKQNPFLKSDDEFCSAGLDQRPKARRLSGIDKAEKLERLRAADNQEIGMLVLRAMACA